jgi:hypothetical protein
VGRRWATGLIPELYVGPKDVEILKQVNAKLEQVVDWEHSGSPSLL